MPLNCDCYPGCWGVHSEDWPRIVYATTELADAARAVAVKSETIPYGTYVQSMNELRFETIELLNQFRNLGTVCKPKKKELILLEVKVESERHLENFMDDFMKWKIGYLSGSSAIECPGFTRVTDYTITPPEGYMATA